MAAAAAMVVLGLGLLFQTVLAYTGTVGVVHQQLNAAIYRDQFARLEQDRADALLTEADYLQARSELQRRVLEDVTNEPGAAMQGGATHKTLWALGFTLPLAVGALYMALGGPATGPQRAATSRNGAGHRPHGGGIGAQAGKVFLTTCKAGSCWGARYKMLGRNQEAEKAFERATPLIEQDAQLLAVYADLAASNANGNFKGKPWS